MAKRLRLAGMLTVVLTAFLALPGCEAAGEPASTESLLVRYATNANNDNFHAAANVDLVLSLVGYRVAIPITADLDIAGNALHGTVHGDLSKLGVNDYDAEIYAKGLDDSVVCHVGTKVKDAVVWNELSLKTLQSLDAFAATNLLASAEFNRVALDSDEEVCYELDIPTTTLVDTAMSVVDVADLPDEFDANALKQALEGDRVKSYFTKSCLIHSAETIAMGTYAGEVSNNIPVSIKVNARIVFDRYGEIDAETLNVPAEVANKSSRTTLHEKDPFNVLAVVGDDNPLAQRVNE